MKTLFARILILLVASTLVTAVGLILIDNLIDPDESMPERFARFMLAEARRAYERDGPEGLSNLLRGIDSSLGTTGILIDPAGRDLLTGEDRSELVAGPQEHIRFLPRRLAFLAQTSDQNGYSLLLEMPVRESRRWGLLWAVISLITLGYILARQLAVPVRTLQTAVDRFGAGDLSARVGFTRRDELGELARTFDQMAVRIESLVGNQRRLLRDISHELRSPLTRLEIAVELARSGGDSNDALNRIEMEAGRLNALVSEVLSISRAESGVATLSVFEMDFKQLVEDVISTCSPEAEQKRCALEADLQELSVRGDEELLRRAIENVLRNAIRYSPEDAAVTITLEEREKHAIVRIRDRGPGVPEGSLSTIFDAFYRVHEDRSRASGGSGLGLTIARNAVELHHGEIHAQNAQPGLEVEIRLPL